MSWNPRKVHHFHNNLVANYRAFQASYLFRTSGSRILDPFHEKEYSDFFSSDFRGNAKLIRKCPLVRFKTKDPTFEFQNLATMS